MTIVVPLMSPSHPVSYAGVTMHALHRIARRRARSAHQLVHKLPVTADAVGLHDVLIARGDLDRLMKILQRERLAVPVSMIGLGQVLGDEFVRQVAVDALGRLVMTRSRSRTCSPVTRGRRQMTCPATGAWPYVRLWLTSPT